MTEKNEESHPNHLSPIHQAMLAEGERERLVKMGADVKKLSGHDVLAIKSLDTALSGSPHAINQVFRLMKEASLITARQLEGQIEKGRLWRDLQQQKVDQAVASGEDPNLITPHPDDFVIDYDRGFSIAGPIDQTELQAVLQTCRVRDVLIMQSAMEERLEWPEHRAGDEEQSPRGQDPFEPEYIPSPFPGSAALLAMMLNNTLPARFKASHHEVAILALSYESKTKRELLKLTRDAWKSLGITVSRGWCTPPAEILRHQLSAYQDIAKEVFEQHDTSEEASQRDLAFRLFHTFGGKL